MFEYFPRDRYSWLVPMFLYFILYQQTDLLSRNREDCGMFRFWSCSLHDKPDCQRRSNRRAKILQKKMKNHQEFFRCIFHAFLIILTTLFNFFWMFFKKILSKIYKSNLLCCTKKSEKLLCIYYFFLIFWFKIACKKR